LGPPHPTHPARLSASSDCAAAAKAVAVRQGTPLLLVEQVLFFHLVMASIIIW